MVKLVKSSIINLNEMLGLTDDDMDNTKKGTTEVNLSQLVPLLSGPLIAN